MDAIRGELEFLAENDLIKPEDVQASLDRITVFADLAPAVKDADYIIEATREDLALKQDLFEELEKLTKPEAVLASNTSSLSLSEMIAKVGEEKQKKCMVCHWYNPPHIMPLVELSFFGNMDEETFNEVRESCIRKPVSRPARLKRCAGNGCKQNSAGCCKRSFFSDGNGYRRS